MGHDRRRSSVPTPKVWNVERSKNGGEGVPLDPHRGEGRHRLEHDERPVVLGVPLGARSAHVVELGAIRIEQGAGERLEDVGDIGEQARRLALQLMGSDYGSHRAHDTFRFLCRLAGCCSCLLVFAFWSLLGASGFSAGSARSIKSW